VRAVLIAAMLALLAPAAARADALEDEIVHLIAFVRQSPCTFIRNGSEYAGPEAADHIQAKYEHFKSRIKTVEDFIARAASRSILSGKPYAVRCDGKTVPAADWIRAEDAAYRAQHGK
jgi:hypothetical protein